MRTKIQVVSNAVRSVRRGALQMVLANIAAHEKAIAEGKPVKKFTPFRVIPTENGYAPAVQTHPSRIVILNTNRHQKKRDAINEIRAKYDQIATEYKG